MKNLYRCETCKDFSCECSTDFDLWEPDGCIFGGGIPRWKKVENLDSGNKTSLFL